MWKKSRERAKNRGKGRKKRRGCQYAAYSPGDYSPDRPAGERYASGGPRPEFEQAAGITRPHQGLAGEADSNSRLNLDMKTEK